VLEACRRAGRSVPDEIAVVGVDSDETVCLVSNPALSSVAADHVRVGYEAARLMDALMAGEAVGESPLLIPPRGVVTRLSSDVLATEDTVIAEAMRLIREHACEGIDVGEVARRVGTSRTTLKRRFQGVLKRSVHDEIVAAQLKRARQLLAETELPLKRIAGCTGFRRGNYLNVVFKARVGMTPGEYRRQTLKHP